MTHEQKKAILRQYANTRTKDIAESLGVAVHHVNNFAQQNGLKKSVQYMELEKQRRREQLKEVGQSNWFRNGQTPHNKGISPDAETYEKMRKTFFKKGRTTHNEKHDGYERINPEGYTEIRISRGVFKLKHHLVWNQTHGQIPRNHILVFKDGNKQNCTLENLECITYAENMRRNSIHNYPPELIPIIKTISKLNKKIKTHEKQN